ncbi:MAG: glycosyltransferase [Actinophytocola sp.]|nr:glycosyltransferase [Actinophytocola sp.]
MRIGVIAPPSIPVPPPAYGGTEAVVDNLARGLSALGHEVRLFTVGEPEVAHVLAAYEELADADVIHDHTALGPLLAAGSSLPTPPVVTTAHGAFDAMRLRSYARIAETVAVVAVSRAQRRYARRIPISAVIHHGVDLDTYTDGPGGGGYLLFVGRMSEDKGVHRAVRIARRAGRMLVIVTTIREPAERRYYEERVAPLLRPDDPQPIEAPLAQRVELMRHADALLSPITWPEPFGLVMAESLACGTPVLAFSYGAAPEIIDHGTTGYLCDGEDQMVAALDRLGELDRVACRNAAVTRFAAERMARDHEHLYRRLTAAPWPRRGDSTADLPSA